VIRIPIVGRDAWERAAQQLAEESRI